MKAREEEEREVRVPRRVRGNKRQELFIPGNKEERRRQERKGTEMRGFTFILGFYFQETPHTSSSLRAKKHPSLISRL